MSPQRSYLKIRARFAHRSPETKTAEPKAFSKMFKREMSEHEQSIDTTLGQ